MSDPRDEACARQAFNQTRPITWEWDVVPEWQRKSLIEAARLGRENWTPTDPLLLKAREIVAATEGFDRAGCLNGRWDQHPTLQVALAALREGIRMAKEGSDV